VGLSDAARFAALFSLPETSIGKNANRTYHRTSLHFLCRLCPVRVVPYFGWLGVWCVVCRCVCRVSGVLELHACVLSISTKEGTALVTEQKAHMLLLGRYLFLYYSFT
jgi:hypothetical protein